MAKSALIGLGRVSPASAGMSAATAAIGETPNSGFEAWAIPALEHDFHLAPGARDRPLPQRRASERQADRQGVEFGAKERHRPRFGALVRRRDAMAAETGNYLVRPGLLEDLADLVRRSCFFAREFGHRVKLAPPDD
jgi:hypothetical protein